MTARYGFTIHWNGPAARCVDQPHSRCQNFWAAVRNYHVNTKGWSDIAYSFGVCPHGVRFTGRGWTKSQFANGEDVVGPDDGGDKYWFTVLAFLGEGEVPTSEMVEGVRALIAEGRSSGRCGPRVLPHNAFKRKTCPGTEFTIHAKAWDDQPLENDMPLSDADLDKIKFIVAAELGKANATLYERLRVKTTSLRDTLAALVRRTHP
jgi:hypothetical protein